MKLTITPRRPGAVEDLLERLSNGENPKDAAQDMRDEGPPGGRKGRP